MKMIMLKGFGTWLWNNHNTIFKFLGWVIGVVIMPVLVAIIIINSTKGEPDVRIVGNPTIKIDSYFSKVQQSDSLLNYIFVWNQCLTPLLDYTLEAKYSIYLVVNQTIWLKNYGTVKASISSIITMGDKTYKNKLRDIFMNPKNAEDIGSYAKMSDRFSGEIMPGDSIPYFTIDTFKISPENKVTNIHMLFMYEFNGKFYDTYYVLPYHLNQPIIAGIDKTENRINNEVILHLNIHLDSNKLRNFFQYHPLDMKMTQHSYTKKQSRHIRKVNRKLDRRYLKGK